MPLDVQRLSRLQKNVRMPKIIEKSGWKQRTWLMLGVVTFVGCFQQVYLNWLYPVFGYYGFEHNDPKIGYLWLAWGLSVCPALWMPIKLTRPSLCPQLIYWVLYLTVLIPSMFVPLYRRWAADHHLRHHRQEGRGLPVGGPDDVRHHAGHHPGRPAPQRAARRANPPGIGRLSERAAHPIPVVPESVRRPRPAGARRSGSRPGSAPRRGSRRSARRSR